MSEIANLISAVVLLTAGAGNDEAARGFQGLGFTSLVIAEGTLLISGPEALFERRFNTEIVHAPDGLHSYTVGTTPALARNLPITALAPDLRGRVAAIGFEALPDFGPPSFDQPAGFAAKEVTMPTLSAAVILKNPGDTQDAANGFGRLGFQVTTISAGVLLLTADAPVFEKEFGTALTVDDTGARRVSGGAVTRSLPMDALPSPLREMVSEVEFEAPPDFGPGNF